MGSLIDAYTNFPAPLRFYWAVAVAASLVFVIQMILTFIGVGHTDAGGDAFDGSAGDANGDTLDTGGAIQLFTVRNIVNFLLGVGWGGVCFWNTCDNKHLVTIVAFICGLAFVIAFMFMLKQLMKLQHGGNFRIDECVGMTCSVYLRVPARRKGSGKVQLSWHGSVLEIEALTDGEQIPSGAKVRVSKVIDSHSLLVEPL